MPITYDVKDNGRLVHAIANGALTGDDLLAYVNAVAVDKLVAKGDYNELLDFSLAVDGEVSLDVLKHIAELMLADPSARAARKLAIVVGAHASVEKVEFYEQLVGDIENMIIFSSPSTALTWLGYE